MALSDLKTLINSSAQNTSQFKGLSAAYGILLGGTPTIDGYTNLINTNNTTNFGAGGSTVFNDENIYINTINALYQGNPTAKASFDAIVSSAATIQDALTLVYNYVIPASARTEAGLNYFKSQASFYAARAAELGVAGTNGTALVAFASLTKIAVDNDIGGLGDTINDLKAAVDNNTAQIPQSGNAFTPLETADGTQFDADDVGGGGNNQGQTFTLTTAIDNLTGTLANDTFVAGVTGAGDNTLTAGDAVNGGAGTDRINIFGNANSAAFAGANITSVEQVYAQVSAAGATALDVSTNADVQQAWLANGTTGANTVTLTKSQTAGLQGNVGTTATFAFTSTAGAADSANLALAGATATTGVVIAGIETLNIAASGTNSLGTLTAAAASKLVVTGDGKLTATLSNDAAYKTIDASANTGGVTLVASGAVNSAQVLDIKTGSGVDSYTTLFANLTKDDKIDLGVGTDTLAFADAVDLSTSTKAGVLAGVTNVEVLRVDGAGNFIIDGDSVSQATFYADTTGALTATTVSNADTIVVGDVVLAASTVGMKLGQNTLNLGLEGTKTAVSDASAGITVSGASTLNVSSSGQPDVGANKLALTSDDNGTIKLTGAKDLVLTTALNTGNTGLQIDGSAFTGKLDVTGTGVADIVIGGSGADTIRAFAGGVDTLTGNAGNDTFVVFGADLDIAAGTIAVTDVITDFTGGADKLGGFGTAASATNYVENATAFATLAALITAADTALDGTVKYYVAMVGSNTYVAFDDDGIGFTSLVQLTGVNVDGIAQADIIA